MNKYQVRAESYRVQAGFIVSLNKDQAKLHASRLSKMTANEYTAINPIVLMRGEEFGCNMDLNSRSVIHIKEKPKRKAIKPPIEEAT